MRPVLLMEKAIDVDDALRHIANRGHNLPFIRKLSGILVEEGFVVPNSCSKSTIKSSLIIRIIHTDF